MNNVLSILLSSMRTKHMRQTIQSVSWKQKWKICWPLCNNWAVTMHKLFAILLTLLCLFVSSTKPSEIPIQFQNQYISGLLPDYNLCQIFRPVAGSSGTRYFQGARPVSNVSEHVRYIVIHKCRWSSRQKEFYQPYVNQAYECEDTDFVQVITVIDLFH